ncbi:MAG: alpha/beta hydrolase [Polyangiaceae bacterium]
MSGPLLTHSKVTADGATPSAWVVFLHGVFGMGLNLRTLAKAVVDERPAWGALLVDLRGHGANPPFPPPHTLATASADVGRLVSALGLSAPVIVGHSLGGKTTLAYAKQFPGTLRRAVVLDAMPGARPADAATGLSRSVLHFLESLPRTMASREEFTRAARDAGFTATVVEWLAMNVRRAPDGSFALRLDLPAIRAMLVDYYHQDLWEVVEDASYVEELDLVIAGASAHYAPADRERAEQGARSRNGMKVHVVEGAGHWLHVDAPDAVRARIREALDGVAAPGKVCDTRPTP